MGQVALVGHRLEDGQKLLEQLARDGFGVTAAAWIKKTAEDDWYLYIASPVVDAEGVYGGYGHLQKAFLQLPEPFWVDRFDVKLLGDTSPTTRDLLKNISGTTRRVPISYRGGPLGNLPVEIAFLYPPLHLVANGVHETLGQP